MDCGFVPQSIFVFGADFYEVVDVLFNYFSLFIAIYSDICFSKKEKALKKGFFDYVAWSSYSILYKYSVIGHRNLLACISVYANCCILPWSTGYCRYDYAVLGYIN